MSIGWCLLLSFHLFLSDVICEMLLDATKKNNIHWNLLLFSCFKLVNRSNMLLVMFCLPYILKESGFCISSFLICWHPVLFFFCWLWNQKQTLPQNTKPSFFQNVQFMFQNIKNDNSQTNSNRRFCFLTRIIAKVQSWQSFHFWFNKGFVTQ